MKDLSGRTYATVAEVKAGDKIEVHATDFGCIEEDGTRIVFSDRGELYVVCGQGMHYLSGHLSSDGTYYNNLYIVPKDAEPNG